MGRLLSRALRDEGPSNPGLLLAAVEKEEEEEEASVWATLRLQNDQARSSEGLSPRLTCQQSRVDS